MRCEWCQEALRYGRRRRRADRQWHGRHARSQASESYCECFLQADWCRSWSDPQPSRQPLQKPEWHVRAAPKPPHGQRPTFFDALRVTFLNPQPPAFLDAFGTASLEIDLGFPGRRLVSLGSPLSASSSVASAPAGAISFSPAAGRRNRLPQARMPTARPAGHRHLPRLPWPRRRRHRHQ